MRLMIKGRGVWRTAGAGVAIELTTASPSALGATGPGGFSLQPTYRADDFAGGQAMYILPAGENGLVNLAQLKRFFNHGVRPKFSQDQLAPYENLEFGYPSLTDSTLGNFYLAASFGRKPAQATRPHHPSPPPPVSLHPPTPHTPP